jgi:hypothetical protein
LTKVLGMNPFINPFSPRHPATRRLAHRNGVITALSLAAGGALGLAFTTIVVENGLVPHFPLESYRYQSADASETGQGSSTDEARALVDVHDCWTGSDDIPADMRGELPGHVVVTSAGTERPAYSAAMVGPALDQVFGAAADTGLVVHAFCR